MNTQTQILANTPVSEIKIGETYFESFDKYYFARIISIGKSKDFNGRVKVKYHVTTKTGRDLGETTIYKN